MVSDEALIQEKDALTEAWPSMSEEERVEAFRRLPRGMAGDFFLERSARTQAILLSGAPEWEQRLLVRMLAPDDAADVLQEMEPEDKARFLGMLDVTARKEVAALLAYAEDEAGGLMSPRFVRVRPDMTVDEAISYVRRQSRERAEIIYYVYVLDAEQKLQGVLSFRDLFASAPGKLVRDVMERDVVTVGERADQEEVAKLIAKHDVLAIPVVDDAGRMRGIVTVDDVVDVVQTEATEDIQKLGGAGALDAPYLQTGLFDMIKKRAPWLVLLFVGEMFTVSAMRRYEHALEAATFLAVFVPLLISSGGNSGSQATTLVVRAMALGEVRLKDWWRILRREILTGLSLGLILGTMGLLSVLGGNAIFGEHGGYAGLLSLTLGLSVVCIVTWGTLVGSMLPFLLRRMGFDPASASAPFVATLVDVSGLVIYFSIASLVLGTHLG